MNSKMLLIAPLLGAALSPGVAFGNVIYHVSLNTTPLMSSLSGPFAVDFQFVDGSGIGDSNNSVTVDNFNFGSGGPSGVPLIIGSATGDLGTGITLTDAEFFNVFNQRFTPGALLSFTVTLTANPEAVDVPDLFSFAILDGNGFGDPILIANIDSSNPALLGFASRSLSLDAPTITAVPEPSFRWMVMGACCLLVGLRSRSTCSRN